MDATTSNTKPTPIDAGLPDGGGSEFLILHKFIVSKICYSLEGMDTLN